MLPKFCSSSGTACAACLMTCVLFTWQGDKAPPNVLREKYQGYQLEYLQNSPTLSQAIAMNASGSIIGLREKATSLEQEQFYFDNDGFKTVPMPDTFTNLELIAISDTNLVVGRAMKAIGSDGSLRGIVWSAATNEIKLLPTPEGDRIADATDISADGKRITGYATGKDRLRPVVWDWNADKATWEIEVLPTILENNPYLMSSRLIVSPDGSTIVGCCTEKILDNGIIDSSLFEWRKVDGKWTRRLVTVDQMYVRAMNNKGQIAGSIAAANGRAPCLVTSTGTVTRLELLPGDETGEARDINEDSVIVGWSEDPRGTDGGAVPCLWNVEGKPTQVKLSDLEYGMLFAINDKGHMAGAAEVITKQASKPNAGDEEAAMLAVRITKAK